MATEIRQRKVFYGWWIVIAGAVASALNLGIFQIGTGAFIKDVQHEFGWSLATISLGFSIRQFQQGLMAPLFGYVMDRVGPRPLASAGIVTMGIGLVLFSRMHSVWQLYLSTLTIALGQGMGAQSGFGRSMVSWFRRKRGQAAGIIGFGQAMAYVGVLPITYLLVHYGWRMAALIAAIVFVAVSLPLAQVIRRRPEPYGLRPDGDPPETKVATPEQARSRGEDSVTVGEALRSRPYYCLMACSVLYSFTTTVNQVHQIPQMRSAGFTVEQAAFVVALYGGVQALGRPISGFLGDLVGRHRVYMLSFLMLGIGWVAFAFISPTHLWTVGLYYVTFGIGHSAHTASGQSQMADYFGPGRFATLQGITSGVALFGGVSGPLFAGLMYDRFGSYLIADLCLGPVISLGFVAMVLAGRPTRSGMPDKGPGEGKARRPETVAPAAK